MQFLTSLFGGSGMTAITAALALGIVLVMIVLLVWVLKFVFKASSSVGRGRTPRLMLIDSMHLDAKRQLIIVRRDNVEHLILTGGAQDVVIETGIAVDPAVARRPVLPVAANAPRETVPPNPFVKPEDEVGPTQPHTGALDRLRDYARPLGKRTAPSLRHTGLMRPVSRMEVIPGNLEHPVRDSAKSTPLVETKGGDAGIPRDGIKAGSQ